MSAEPGFSLQVGADRMASAKRWVQLPVRVRRPGDRCLAPLPDGILSRRSACGRRRQDPRSSSRPAGGIDPSSMSDEEWWVRQSGPCPGAAIRWGRDRTALRFARKCRRAGRPALLSGCACRVPPETSATGWWPYIGTWSRTLRTHLAAAPPGSARMTAASARQSSTLRRARTSSTAATVCAYPSPMCRCCIPRPLTERRGPSPSRRPCAIRLANRCAYSRTNGQALRSTSPGASGVGSANGLASCRSTVSPPSCVAASNRRAPADERSAARTARPSA